MYSSYLVLCKSEFRKQTFIAYTKSLNELTKLIEDFNSNDISKYTILYELFPVEKVPNRCYHYPNDIFFVEEEDN